MEFADVDIAELQRWVGKTETVSDQITTAPIVALRATLDIDAPPPRPGDPLPPLWHWLYFLTIHRQSELGPEGHTTKGGFLPPVTLPRRMWAGGRFEFRCPLRVGETLTRTSRIVDVQHKEGRAGPLVFVVVRHEIGNAEGMALCEEQDLVFRGHSKPGEPMPTHQPAPADPKWERIIRPDDVLLFRYSALTFNAHRIHYDYRYATGVEGYPGLVVHGPLIATMLLDLARRNMPEANVARFSFRAVSPLFDTTPFRVCGKPEKDGKTVSLWARNEAGDLATAATAVTL
ncbi:MAG: MaoC family dehydratase N-terminal domain-containing protein [Candidatus Acidiferrales bacterium]